MPTNPTGPTFGPVDPTAVRAQAIRKHSAARQQAKEKLRNFICPWSDTTMHVASVFAGQIETFGSLAGLGRTMDKVLMATLIPLKYLATERTP